LRIPVRAAGIILREVSSQKQKTTEKRDAPVAVRGPFNPTGNKKGSSQVNNKSNYAEIVVQKKE